MIQGHISLPTISQQLPVHNTRSKLTSGAVVLLTLLVVFLCLPSVVRGSLETCTHLDHGEITYILDHRVNYFEDTDASKSIEEIQRLSKDSWTTVDGETPNFGFTDSAYWFKLDVCQGHQGDEPIILQIRYPLLDDIEVCGFQNGEEVFKDRSGDKITFEERAWKYRNFIFRLPDISQAPLTLYVRVQTESAVQVPITLFTESGFFEHSQKVLLVQGVYFGIVIAILIFNILVYAFVREEAYLYYIAFTVMYFSFQAVLQGFFQQYTMESLWWHNNALLLFGFFSIGFANLFARSFLQLQEHKPFMSKLLIGVALICFLSVFFTTVLPYGRLVELMLVLVIPSATLILYSCYCLSGVGHLPARIFSAGWTVLLVAFILATLNKFAVLPRSFWTENIMQIGGVFEIILLSAALGAKINEEKQQRIVAEKQLSKSLEKQVKERTISLRDALDKLEAANSILDKMSLTDGLTELSNRRAFDTQFEVEYQSAVRNGAPLALLMLDIDYFKDVNDIHGHQAGDKVLQVFARTLRSVTTRPRDKVYRYGGEEFAVVLYNTNLDGAFIVAEKMRQEISHLHFNFEGKDCAITTSVGICVYLGTVPNELAPPLENIIEQADKNLYQAKASGRNRVEGGTLVSTGGLEDN